MTARDAAPAMGLAAPGTVDLYFPIVYDELRRIAARYVGRRGLVQNTCLMSVRRSS